MNRTCENCKATETKWWKITDTGFLCNPCYKHKWYIENVSTGPRKVMTPEELSIATKMWAAKYRAENKDKRKSYSDSRKTTKAEYDRTYRKNNREKINKKRYDRIANSLQAKMAYKLRSRIKDAIRDGHRGQRKAGSAVRDLGCNLSQLRTHLESQFKTGMTWNNWSIHGWHIDHIKPLALFDLTDREEFLQAAHYTNLQPLWAMENMRKGKKYE